MVDIGFTVDSSTAGSSVRFDPKNAKDKVNFVHNSSRFLSFALPLIVDHDPQACVFYNSYLRNSFLRSSS
jgi:hypothetical protein